MTIAETISADIRARADYLPPCPLCSFVSVADMADIVRGPTFRRGRNGSATVSLFPCCKLSTDCPWMETEAEAAAWWREQRQRAHADAATDSRRRNQLTKLAAKGLEFYQP